MSDSERPPVDPNSPIPRLIGSAFGLAFGGIGLTILIFMWTKSFNDWDSPPLFFRVFASFLAIPFIITGFGALAGGLGPAKMSGLVDRLKQTQKELGEESEKPAPSRYICPNCSAPLASQADVSPHGDAKCIHCGAWFNIHG